MRLPLATLLTFSALGSFAQPGACDDLVACFTPSELGTGVVSFASCSQPGTNTQYVWHFGDGSDGSGMAPVHTYLAAGTYTVCLVAYWNNCVDEFCLPITIGGIDPCAEYQACFATTALQNNGYFFDNCSPMGNAQFQWDISDGSTFSSTNLEHHFTQPGHYTVCLTGYWGNCVDSTCVGVDIPGGNVCDDLLANFSFTTDANTGVFTNTTTGTGASTTWSWEFGDGGTSNDGSPFHTYDTPGTYEVCLTAVSIHIGPNGAATTCVDTHCAGVTVGDVGSCGTLVAGFTVNASPLDVVFISTTTGTGNTTTYHWDFGDGTEGSGSTIGHIYPGLGTYEACLTVVSTYLLPNGDEITCDDVFCAAVVIGGPCNELEACFVASAAGLNAILFNNCTAPSTTVQYEWHFGDGATGSDAAPTHTYDGPGSYPVCLVAYWNNCVDEFCLTVVVEGGDPCAEYEACFTTANLQGNVYFFDNCSPAQEDGQFVWTFGDGSGTTSVNADHHYDQSGTYEVCLTATWGDCVEHTCDVVVVGGVGPCEGLEAGFAFLSSGGGYQFTNTTTGTGNPTTWEWDFHDGTGSTMAQPFHEFPEPGVYEVCLSVTSFFIGPNGAAITCEDTYCAAVTVQGGPCNDLVACFEPSQLSSTGYFFNNCSSPSLNATFVWLFGDGSTSAELAPIHTFAEAGVYTVCLIATWSNGCVDEECEVLTVGEDPCEGFNACFVTNYLQQPGAFFFDNCTAGQGNAQFVWDFGDGGSSTGTNVDHVYQANGNYTVCLTAYYGNCSDSTCAGVVVSDVGDFCDGLVACFEPQPFENGAYFFANCSQLLPIDIPAYYLWNFGDGTTSDNAQPDHAFAPGTYTVCLTVTHGNCVDETCTTITVIGPGDPCTNFNAGFTTFLSPNGIQFSNTTSGTGFQTTFLWSFGDGSSSTDPQPLHPYQFPGTYNVCLVATSIYEGQNGGLITCVDDYCMMVTTNGGDDCNPNYATEFTWTAQGTAVVFIATSNFPTVGYIWHFGDGSDEGFGNIITHLYEPPGPYEVCLDAWYWNEATEDTCWVYRCHLVDPFGIGNGIADIAADDITVFPIPARDVLTVSGLPASATLRLFAADGRLVLTERATSTTHQVHVAGLASGTYVLRIDVGERAMYRRVAVE